MGNKGGVLSKSRGNKKKSLPWGALVLVSMQMFDFLLTYWGINTLGVVREANPLMVFMFEINFPLALFIRVMSILTIYWLLVEIKSKHKESYRNVVAMGIICNIFVMYLHYQWISFFYPF